ncbi:MAG: VCBS repeat-containing protein [Candidatus Limnocylindrales bacterium]
MGGAIVVRRTASVVLIAAMVASAVIVAKPGPPARAAEPGYWNDFNGDGYADLAIGVPYDSVGGAAGAGVVNVIYGSSTGLVADGDQVWSQAVVAGVGGQGAESADHFGRSLATGDFDDDGYGDLAVGVPGEDFGGMTDAGIIQVIYGSPTGLIAAGAFSFPNDRASGDQFGSAMIGLDHNDDGIADLAVTRPGNADVLMFPGSATGLSGADGGLDCGAFACSALAAGDIDHDGSDDLVAGSPNATVAGKLEAGKIFIFWGDGSSPDTFSQDDTTNGTSQAGAHFGAAVAVGRFLGGDALADVAVGAPGLDFTFRGGPVKNAGAVVQFMSAGAGLELGVELRQGMGNVPDKPGKNDAFGSALAIANLGMSSDLDLAIGAPGDRVSGVTHGKAIVLFSPTQSQVWHQGVPNVLGTPTQGDKFGASLFAADFGRSGQADLAVGVPKGEIGSASDGGEVTIAYGSSNGLTTTHNQLWSQESPGIGETSESGDRFGTAIH